jgi:hypothetical protein
MPGRAVRLGVGISGGLHGRVPVEALRFEPDDDAHQMLFAELCGWPVSSDPEGSFFATHSGAAQPRAPFRGQFTTAILLPWSASFKKFLFYKELLENE